MAENNRKMSSLPRTQFSWTQFAPCLLFTCPGLGSELKIKENYRFVPHLLLGAPVLPHFWTGAENNRKWPICPAPTFYMPRSCLGLGPGLKIIENNPFSPYLLYTCPGLEPGQKIIENNPFAPYLLFTCPGLVPGHRHPPVQYVGRLVG